MSAGGRPSILYRHFFRRFFDNDTLSLEGDTQTTVIRAVSACAVPCLMVAFWLLPHYPHREHWAGVADQYFFVLYSFVIVGCVAAFEWDMLFPDRKDFLVLSPLPIGRFEFLSAKLSALATFLALFVTGANLFGLVLLPALTSGHLLRHVWAHAASTVLAAVFSSCLILSLQGLCMWGLGERAYRTVSPFLQALMAAWLLLLLLLYPLFAGTIQFLVSGRFVGARYVPPLWFLGLYQSMADGAPGQPFLQLLAREALWGTIVLAASATITYLGAWHTRRTMILEGAATRSRAPGMFYRALDGCFIRMPQHRAVFAFISHTTWRNPRYRSCLALYAGVGLALVASCVVTFTTTSRQLVALSISRAGCRDVLPLAIFWVLAGLRSTFSFPISMSCRWLFAMDPPATAVISAAVKLWAQLCCVGVVAAFLLIVTCLRFSTASIVAQGVCGIGISIVLTELFFRNVRGVPFTLPRLPGRTNFSMLLVVYTVGLPSFISSTVMMEKMLERRAGLSVTVLLVMLVVYSLLLRKRRNSGSRQEPLEGAEEMAGEAQLFSITGRLSD